jgi:hypothetical protein
MSIWINVDLVEAVLLPDGWHEIGGGMPGIGFDAYEFIWWGSAGDDWRKAKKYREQHKNSMPDILLSGRVEGIPSTGYYFQCTCHGHLAGPATAILAVRYRDESEFEDDE